MLIQSVVLDIEGTTTPIHFVYEVLFPYARERMRQFVDNKWREKDVADIFQTLAADNVVDLVHGAPAIHGTTGPEFLDGVNNYCLWLMSEDRKSTALKSIQGMIWEQGFRSGQLHGEVFTDVPVAFKKWHDENRVIAIYSSGSVLAQQLLFRHSRWGDLAGYITHHYDTRVGAKRDVASYRAIVARLECESCRCMFVSDVVEELDAARQAGLHTTLSIREGNTEPTHPHDHPVIHSFDELVLE